jgi:hypothetical protein
MKLWALRFNVLELAKGPLTSIPLSIANSSHIRASEVG